MKEYAYAKINLALDVVSRREDGYHELKMVMIPILLHDLIYLEPINKGIEIISEHPFIPTNQKNIMYQAAQLMIDTYKINAGVKIVIYKHIPIQAGLGGGSADGAAVMRAMNKVFNLALSNECLANLGKKIGADVPFCIHQKSAYVEGIGEKISFIDSKFESYILLVKPKKGISTKLAFENLDLMACKHPDLQKMKISMINNDYCGVIDNLGNSLEQPSFKLVNELDRIKEELLELGFDGALMSGSGSTIFGLTKDRKILEQGFEKMKKKYYFVNKTKVKQLNEQWGRF
jgi:4-diphosphocytidyl-2C-methyl-D-erythritol kinase